MVVEPRKWPEAGCELPPCPKATRREIASACVEFVWELLLDFGAGERPAWRRASTVATFVLGAVVVSAAWVVFVAAAALGGLVGFFLVLPALSLRALWVQIAVSTQECKRIRWDASAWSAAAFARASAASRESCDSDFVRTMDERLPVTGLAFRPAAGRSKRPH